MNFINEKDVSRLKRSKKAGKISGFIENRTGCDFHIHTHLVCDDVGQSCFTQTGRAVEKGVVQRLAPEFCGLDVDMEIGHNLPLTREIFKVLRSDNSVQILIFVLDTAVRVEI